jgi:hypothetical protein
LRGSAGQEEQDKLYFDTVTEYGKEEALRFSPCSIERPGYRDEKPGMVADAAVPYFSVTNGV